MYYAEVESMDMDYLNDFSVLFQVGLQRNKEVHVEGFELKIVQVRLLNELKIC